MKSIYLILTACLTMILTISCKKNNNQEELSQDHLIQQQIEELRAKTRGFHNIQIAHEAGWDTDLSGCVEHPTEGGMGHHFARMEYMDGRVNYLEPQVLLYVLNEQGEMEFLGVEYVVPFDFHSADELPPILFDQHFHANHEQGFWALHVWTEKENPKGMFYDWNPHVSCP